MVICPFLFKRLYSNRAELLASLSDSTDGFFWEQRGVAEDGGGCAQLAEGAEDHYKR